MTRPIAIAEPATAGRNMRQLIAFAAGDATAPVARAGEDLPTKTAFIAALDRVQVYPTPAPVGPDPVVHFVEGPEDPRAEMAGWFVEADAITPAAVLAPAEREAVTAGVARGMELLRAYDDGYAATVAALVGSVLCVRDPGLVSSSLSSQIGTVAVNPQPGWTRDDFAEALLHEGVHQAQFLDQMIDDWFTVPHTQLGAPEARVVSPIRKQNRPLNLTLDAACVAVALVDFLWWRGARERAADMAQSLRVSLDGIRQRAHLLTDRGAMVLDDLADVAAASPAHAAAV